MTSSELKFTAWHPLLVRTLRSLLDTQGNQRMAVSSVLAILTRIPVPPESCTAIDEVLPLLRSFLQNYPLGDALKCEVDFAYLHEFAPLGRTHQSGSSCLPKKTYRSLRKRQSRKKAAVCGSDQNREVSETDQPVYRETRKVHVHECVLLSDSDGFAAFTGDIPPAGTEVIRGSMDVNSLYIMYRALFGSFPTVIGSFDMLVHALIVYCKFSTQNNIPGGIKVLCDFFAAGSGLDIENESTMSMLACRHWINWQILIRQGSRCIAYLVEYLLSVVGADPNPMQERCVNLLLGQLRKNISVSVFVSNMIQADFGFNDLHLACIDDVLRSTNEVSMIILDDVCTIVGRYSEKHQLSVVGACLVAWMEDPVFPQLLPRILQSIQSRLRINKASSAKESRFAFELFASLLDNSSLTDPMFHWCQSLPSGFLQTVTGVELVAVLISQMDTSTKQCAKAMRRHLPVMSWCDSSRTSSFSSTSSTSDETPSRTMVRLAHTLRDCNHTETLVQISSIVLQYCDACDCEFLLMEAVIPSVVAICEKNSERPEVEEAASTEMTPENKGLLKELELIAAYLKTRDAAADVIRSIVVPHREFYFSAFELQDVFVAICTKAARLAPNVALETGLCEWMVDRLTSCQRHASVDIWVLMNDSAAKFSKLLLSILNIISDVLEESKEVFMPLAERLLSCTSALVDVCFEWMGAPTEDYRSIWRLSEVMSKALSIHLMLSEDVSDVNSRFAKAILSALSANPPSQLISCVVCALLDRCVSRFPSSVGSIVSIDQDSEDDALMGEGGPLPLPTRTVLHLELVTTVLQLTAALVRKQPQIDDVLEFAIGKMCKRLTTIDKHSDIGNKWLPDLFVLCDVLADHSASPSILSAVFQLVTVFLKREPTSRHLHNLIGYFFRCNDYKECVLSSLSSLLCDDSIEPLVSLVFPQSAVHQPVEIRSAAQMNFEARKTRLEELEKNPSSSSLLSAVEKFLSSYRSDGETEVERRREKKKRLRDQVRGSSMVSIDRMTGDSGLKSPNLVLANGSAASFTLGSSHQILLTDGLSLSLWINRKMNTKMSSRVPPLHLASIGGDEVSCSCWLTSRGKLYVDVTAGDMKLARVRLKGVVGESSWTHVIFGARVNSEAVSVQATIHDSVTSAEVPLLVRIVQLAVPVTVSFGCIKRRSHHQYYLSSIFGFKGLLPCTCGLVLASLGCQLSSLSETRVEHLVPNLAPLITHTTVALRQHTLEAVRQDVTKYVQKLQRAVVFVIRSNAAHSYAVSVLPADIDPLSLQGQSALSLALLKDYPITWHGRMIQRVHPSVDDALTPLGGIKFIIYLYIKSVNDGLSCQKLALDLLLRCLRRSPFFSSEADRLKLCDIMARTLSSPLAILDDSVMERLVRYCVEWTESPIEWDTSMEDLKASKLDPYQAVIRDPALLVTLCSRSELWRGSRFSVWRHLMAAVASIVTNEGVCAAYKFNRIQLFTADMLPKLLHCVLEMIQDPSNFSNFPLETTLVEDVVTIIQSLLGAPESPQAVAHLWHFVFLSHPASCTYIDHRVQGHSEWLAPEFIRDEGEGELLGDSKLCKTLKHYIRALGKESIAEQWEHGCSPYELRRQFEAIGDVEMTSSSGDSRSNMPDLISDVMLHDQNSDSLSDIPIYIGTGTTRQEDTSKQEPRWVVLLRAGLMNVMATVLQNGTDSLLACLQHDVMSWHAIIVLMSHQTDTCVRDAAVDMLQKFLLRCPPYTKISFLRLSGFHMLASQLRCQPVTHVMTDFLFSMLCGETIRLGDGLDQSHLSAMPVDRISCDSLHAIFVAFEESVPSAPLFWNITNSLLKIFENNSQLQQAMIDNRLVDVMVNTLRRIAYLDPTVDSDIVTDRPVLSLQLEGWSSFAQRIIISSIPYNDVRLNSACERFIWLLMLADIQSTRDSRFPSPKRPRAQNIIRSQLCQLLHCWLESVRTVFSEEGRSASATSSVDSLYNASTSTSCTTRSEEYDYCDDVITPEKANLLEGTSPVAAFIAGSFANLRERISHMGPISRHTLRCSYVKRQGPAPLAPIECLTDRMLFALDAIATVFSILTPTDRVTEEEENLFHFYLYFMLSSWKREAQTPRPVTTSVWNRLVVLCRDRVRVLLAQMVAFVLYPAHRKMHEAAVSTRTDVEILPNWKSAWVEEKRYQIVKALSHELQYKQTLSALLNVNLDYEYALCLGLYELAFVSPVRPEHQEEVEKMIRFLHSCKVGSSFDRFTPDSLNNLNTDEILSMHSYSQHRKTVMAQLRSKMETIRDEEAKLTAHVSEMAMAVTCEVVEEQNLPRKVFIRATKAAINQFVEAENVMLAIAKELCHPESSGFEARHWPVGWALDPTEGPMRERRRLVPYYYPFETRFFKSEMRQSVQLNVEEPPLSALLQNALTARSVLESAQIDEPIRLFLDVTVLRGTFECQGELLVGESHLHFVGEKAKSTQKGTDCSVITMSWRFDHLCEIQGRNHLLKDVALEMFANNGDTYLIVFQNAQKRNLFKCQLVEAGLQHLFPNTDQMVQAVVQSWRHGSMSNFEYLMHLNKLAGRSFNDLMQYPVFPFVLSDYSSALLDLSLPTSYRNFSKPMAIQDKRMEAHYVANYSCLEAECARTNVDHGPLHFGPYHYGSHYSNSGIVVHYLVRLSPFTQIALEYQDNNFDIPDRLFNSIEATWRLSSSESTTDFKELIPEFFCLPEFLRNRDSLELGVRQAGERVGSVRFPTWTPANNPRLFVLIHRQALESATVSQNLHSWVDLIFGFKQTGKAAVDAVNVFHPATYMGHLNADELSDELSQSALRTMVRSYGQMPIQILQTPHLPHLSAGKEKKEKERPPAPLASVKGVRWGDYVGSPEQDLANIQVVLSVKSSKSDRLGRVVSMPDGTVAGVPRGTLIIMQTEPENPKDQLNKTRTLCALAALSWSFSDTMLRFRLIKPSLQPWLNLLELDSNEISFMEYSDTNQLLFIAFSTGLIRVFRLEFDAQGLRCLEQVSDLLAHHSGISSLCISDEFSIVVSGDLEGKVVIWDTNRLSFVRVLRPAGSSPVTAMCVSSTSGDTAVVSQQGYGSKVELFTINGDLVGSVETETTVVCVSMTNQTEGTAVNCMALGMQDGHIRLIEMWCLTVVRDIWHESHVEPIISVEYASSGRKLFAVLSSGRVLCWQSVANMSRARAPQFMIINPHDMSL